MNVYAPIAEYFLTPVLHEIKLINKSNKNHMKSIIKPEIKSEACPANIFAGKDRKYGNGVE